MKKAIIEMGTNSTRLLIAEKSGSKINVIDKALITTRLGEGVDSNKLLNKEAIKRGLHAIDSFQRKIDKHDVQSVKIIGTSALRDVNNSQELIQRIKDAFGYELKIITGKKEAVLTYKGVSQDLDLSNYIIIDIGGGSTEIICQDNQQELKTFSINIGAVRLADRFIKNKKGTLSKSVIEKISIYVNNEFKKCLDIKPGTNNLIGVGGTITSAASIMLKLKDYEPDAIHNYTLKYSDINRILNILRKLELNKRKKVKGLNPHRADIILPGLIILIEVMKCLRTLHLRVSEHDILYGLLVDE